MIMKKQINKYYNLNKMAHVDMIARLAIELKYYNFEEWFNPSALIDWLIDRSVCLFISFLEHVAYNRIQPQTKRPEPLLCSTRYCLKEKKISSQVGTHTWILQ